MTEKCEQCDREFVPNSDFVPRFRICSDYCRGLMYKKEKTTKAIFNGNYHTLRVEQIEKLGFEVKVTKRN